MKSLTYITAFIFIMSISFTSVAKTTSDAQPLIIANAENNQAKKDAKAEKKQAKKDAKAETKQAKKAAKHDRNKDIRKKSKKHKNKSKHVTFITTYEKLINTPIPVCKENVNMRISLINGSNYSNDIDLQNWDIKVNGKAVKQSKKSEDDKHPKEYFFTKFKADQSTINITANPNSSVPLETKLLVTLKGNCENIELIATLANNIVKIGDTISTNVILVDKKATVPAKNNFSLSSITLISPNYEQYSINGVDFDDNSNLTISFPTLKDNDVATGTWTLQLLGEYKGSLRSVSLSVQAIDPQAVVKGHGSLSESGTEIIVPIDITFNEDNNKHYVISGHLCVKNSIDCEKATVYGELANSGPIELRFDKPSDINNLEITGIVVFEGPSVIYDSNPRIE